MSTNQKPYEGILICSDFDGTLSGKDGIAERNREAIADFCAKGGRLTISSGRDAEFLSKTAGGLFNAPLICINGTQIYDTKTEQVLFVAPLDKKAIEPHQDKTIPQPFRLEVIPEAGEKLVFLPDDSIDIPTDSSFEIAKIVTMYDSIELCVAAKEALSQKYPQYDWGRSWTWGLEQIAGNAGKGVCVNWLRHHLGARLVIAIGDFENDASMLKAADIAVAPENALPEIRALCDYVVCHVDQGAVADMIEKLPEILSNL